MENTLSVARYLYDSYHKRFNCPMDQMKMHKLMYFTQRESLMVRKELLFDEDFLGWKYGPVLLSVRREYMNDRPFSDASDTVSATAKELVDHVLEKYGGVSSWKLSSLSHNEFSWKRARKGLKPSDNGNVKLEFSAMKVDAARELAERKRM